jgi:hypothetical protein
VWRELQLAAERFSLGLLSDFLPNEKTTFKARLKAAPAS